MTSESPRSRFAKRCLHLCAALLLAVASAVEPREDDDAEARRAHATAARIEMEWPIAPTGPVTRFIQELGARLGAVAGESGFPWRFLVLRDRSANAFSIGAGRIYVNEGTPFVCRNEAEVAAILAHEMGHELAGHFRSPAAGDPPLDAWRKSGAKEEAIGSVHQRIDPEKELEADRRSIDILRGAGYDPHAAVSVAELIYEQSATRGAHWGGTERLESLRELVAALPHEGRLDSEAFRRLRQEVAPGVE
jgi:predicted Zn-dependent protease